MMKTKFIVLLIAFLLVGGLLYLFRYGKRPSFGNAEESPTGAYRISEPLYGRLTKKAEAGDCDAAHALGRHHVFYSLNTDEAIRWYRLAAKCPNANAKGELVGILMHFEAQDTEVDRLLLEIELLDPTAAKDDRSAVSAVRSVRNHAR